LDVVVDELLLLVDDDATSVAPSPPVADSSCLLVRIMLMFITTSGDGVIGTSDINVNSVMMKYRLLIRMRSMSISSSWSEATMMLVKERQRLNLTDEPKVSLFIEA